jgi:carbon-monoxide dehydrogenase large subunit
MAMIEEKYVGTSLPRKEDRELITGVGRYIDDLTLPGMLSMVMVRSPFAHARITGVDASVATGMPGVVGVYTAADLEGEFIGPMPMAWQVTPDLKSGQMWPITKDKARYQGDIVAAVVAETRAQAKDAAETVDVGYEELPVVVELEAAMAEGAPILHEEFGTNVAYHTETSTGDIDRVFGSAPVVVKERYYLPRMIPNAIEPRGCIGQANPATDELTLWSSTQIPHVTRTTMAAFVLGVPEHKLRVIAPRVGGGFGSKIRVGPEEAVALVLARRLNRPVKWIEERSENYLATHHGRDFIQEIALAADEDGRIRGYDIKLVASMGAYLLLVAPGVPLLGASLYCGPYGGEAYRFACTGVYTNTTPTDAYRGAGRPEATYAHERAMDALARRVGKDPAELRRLNFLPAFTEPTPSIGGLMFDSGDYDATLDKALELVGYEEMREEQRIRREQSDPKQLGIGFSTYVEACGIAPSRFLGSVAYAAGGWEFAGIRFLPTGKVEVSIGTTPHGQGHETTVAQIVADDLGVTPDDVLVIFGDTQLVPRGLDTYGSRSLAVGGIAVHRAAGKIVDKARKIAAHELEVAEEDLEYQAGRFSVKGAPDRAKTVAETAFSAWTAHNLPDGMEPGLDAESIFDPTNLVYPYGAHICVAEVDTETGMVKLLKYVAVDDVGTVINPMIVDGQVAGGVVQGIAEAMFEEGIYDENGQLLTSSMTNYEVPAASDVPNITIGRTVTPSSSNELGVKGAGETGTIASPPAVVNAVIDALSHLGVTDVQRPVSPQNVWRAIQAARGGDGK